MERREEASHRWDYLLCNVFTFLMSVAVVVLTYFFVAGTAQGEVFKVKVVYLLEKYDTEATPSDWTFILLYIILAYQLIWLLYGITTLCTRTKGGYLYYCPLYMPVWIYVFFLIGISIFLAHVFLWDAENMLAALACAALAMVAFVVCVWISYVYLDRFDYTLRKRGLKQEIANVRAMVQNGVEMMSTWCGVVCLILLPSCLADKKSMTEENAATLSFSLLAGAVFYLGVFNLYVLDKYLRCTFSPFIVFAVYLFGVLVRHHEYWWSRNMIFALVLLVVLLLLLFVKILLVMWRTMCCGRYFGCMPSFSCNENGSCCDFSTVDDECRTPVKKKRNSTRKCSVVFNEEPAATTTFCESEPPRQVLNAPMALPPPHSHEPPPCTRPMPAPAPVSCGGQREVLNACPRNTGGCRTGPRPLAQPHGCVNTLMVRPTPRRCCHAHPTCHCGRNY